MIVNYHNVEIIISAVRKEQYPNTVVPEIAMVGRSNVGKSSLINKVLNRRNFARISSTPGKTATINFYNIDNKMTIVDLPGYGYAVASKGEIKKWGNMIDEYLNCRPHLNQVILLVDSRHKPTKDDCLMIDWIRNRCEYAVVFATKIDKLKKSQVDEHLQVIIETLDLNDGDVLIPFSTERAECFDDFWDYIDGCILTKEEE